MTFPILFTVFVSSLQLSGQSLQELEQQARDAYSRKDYAVSAELSKKYYDALSLELRGSANYKLALAAINSAKALQMAGSRTEAVRYVDIACRISRDIETEPSARTGQCLVFAVELKAQAGRIKEASASASQALEVVSKTMAPREAAAGCFHIGEVFRDAHADGDAAEYFAEAARRYDKDLLDDRAYLAAALNERAMSLSRQNLLTEACKEMERAIAIEQSTGSSTIASAISKTYLLADWYRDLGEFDKSIRALQLVAEALRKAPASGHITRADILLQIAERLNHSGGSSEALTVLKEVIASPGQGDQNGRLLRSLAAHRLSGEISFSLHDYDDAEQQYRTAVALAAQLPATEAATRASAVEALAFHFLKRGRYTEARASLEEALAIYEKTSDLDGVATTLETAVVALVNSNDCESALPLLQRATKIRQEIGPKSDGMIRVLKLSISCAENDEAEKDLFEKAFQLQQEVEGGISPSLMVDVAQEMERRGDLAAARKTAEFAVQLNPKGGVVLDVLASIRERSGDLKGAIEARKTSVAVAEEQYGADSVNVAARRFNYASALLHSGDAATARPNFVAAARAFGAHADRQLRDLSLGEQRQLILSQAAVQTGGLLSVSQDAKQLAEAYDLILGWKGLLLEGQRRESLLTRATSGAQNQSTIDRWKTLRSELAAWSSTRGSRPESEWKPIADRLTREKEAVERVLLLGTPASNSPEVSIATVQAALRTDEVFVDIYKFEQLGKEKPESQYAAVVLAHLGPPTYIYLEKASEIEDALSHWLAGLAESAPANWSRLESLVWKRIQTSLSPQIHRVRVSPDGELVRIPWHQFGDDGAHPSREVTEVDSPRSFVSLRSRPSKTDGNGKLLLIGDLDFDSGRTLKSPGIAGKPFPALKWTAPESEAIMQISMNSSVESKWLKRGEATKSEVLASLPNTAFVHFATHGFTNGESEWGLAGRSWDVGPTKRYARDPLIDAGLALSGANVRDPATLESKGILTAEELLDLDLSATRMLVLSACSTALGLSTPAQGVTGLRSASIAAGARNLLMSLWSVDDQATRILMQRFYSALWQEKRSIVEALHEAQLKVKSNARYKAPKFWAGWVIVSVE